MLVAVCIPSVLMLAFFVYCSGRPHVEAMSMGRPVIATHWSGPSEFMTEENSFPLRHDGMVEISTGAFRGHQWAQPSERHLRELLRAILTNPSEAERRGRRARADMVERYCQTCVTRLVVAELARIQQIQTREAKLKPKPNETPSPPSYASDPAASDPDSNPNPTSTPSAQPKDEL